MGRKYGLVYKTVITFDKRIISTPKQIKDFLNKQIPRVNFNSDPFDKKVGIGDISVVGLRDNKVVLLWGVPNVKVREQIDKILSHTLGFNNDDPCGQYKCIIVK